MLCPLRVVVPDYEVYTDASRAYGCGAVWGQRWLQQEWPPSHIDVKVAPKELVVARVVWGQAWQCQVVHAHSDNEKH